MGKASVAEAASAELFQDFVRKNDRTAVYFWAVWSEPCAALQPMFEEVSKAYEGVACVKVEAEKVAEVSAHLQVSAVPTFVFLKGGVEVDRIEGFEPQLLFEKAAKLQDGSSAPSESLEDQLKALVRQHPVMLFMKGSPDAPRCGFSRKVVEALKTASVPFGHFDILQNNQVREGLKTLYDWPTYPQLYAGGELLGGCDIVLEMARTGELKDAIADALQEARIKLPEDEKENVNSRIKDLLAKADVMLFMKGSPDAPRCGFSRRVVAALRRDNVQFAHFDILEDEEIRQGLKEYADWPTFPQLYANSELLGGCDIVEELSARGELPAAIAAELARA